MPLTRISNRPRNRLRRAKTAHYLDASIKKSFEFKRSQENQITLNPEEKMVDNLVNSNNGDEKKYISSTKDPSFYIPTPKQQLAGNIKPNSNTNGTIDAGESATNDNVSSVPATDVLCQPEQDDQNTPSKPEQQQLHSSSMPSSDIMGNSLLRIGRRASTERQMKSRGYWQLAASRQSLPMRMSACFLRCCNTAS